MYAPAVIDRRERQLLKTYPQIAAEYPTGIPRYPVAECHQWMQHLESVMDEDGREVRSLTEEEQHFVGGEQLRTVFDAPYFLERYCNTPEAPIWMADMTVKPIRDVQVGDLVVGWAPLGGARPRQAQNAKGRKDAHRYRDTLTPSRVIAKKVRRAAVVRVVFASGRQLRCTPDHLWRRSYRVIGGAWSHAKRGAPKVFQPWTEAKVGRHLCFVVAPESLAPALSMEQRRQADWLAGIYDGEGSGHRISQDKTANPLVYGKIAEALQALEIEYTADDKGFYINGGRDGYLRFLVLTRPHKVAGLLEVIFSANFGKPDKVIAVVPDGEDDVVSLQTETGNYVAWGYASKNCWIDDSGHGLKPLYPLWESQDFLLRMLAKLEEQQIKDNSPDGLLLNVLKIRQVGITTLGVSLVAHRIFLRPYIRGLVGSDMEAQAAYLFRIAERVYRNLPWWLKPQQTGYNKNREMMLASHSELRTAWGKTTRGALQEVGGKKGNIERGRTYSTFHISELATWDNPDQLDSALLPGIPIFRDTLGLLESTAELSDDWWHRQWQTSARGTGRFRNLFIGNYAVPSKYSLRAPEGYEPSASTKKWAEKAEIESPQWCLGQTIRVTRDQQDWYESTRAFYEAKGKLHEFLKEYPSDPEECFQYAGTSIFTIDQLIKIDEQVKPIIDIWKVEPAREIAELRREDLSLIKPDHRAPAPMSTRVSTVKADAQLIPEGYGFRRLGADHLKEIEGVEGLRSANVLLIWEYPRYKGSIKGASRYVMSVDVSDGVGLDYSCIDVFRMPSIEEPTEQVAQFVSNVLKPVEIARVADAVGRFYADEDGVEALAGVESNIGPGLVTQSELQLHLGYSHFYIWETLDAGDMQARFTKRIGWATTMRTRPIILARLYEGLTTQDPITNLLDLRIHSPITRAEFRHLVIPKEPGARLGDAVAAPGHHDDCSMSAAIGNFLAYMLMGGETESIHEKRHRKAQLKAIQRERGNNVLYDYRNSPITADAMKAGVDDDDDSNLDEGSASLHFDPRAYD